MDKTALVLGATGSFGGAVALEMVRRNWQVRALVRDPARLARLGPGGKAIEAVGGDAKDRATVAAAAAGVAVIVHGVNYPYPQWIPNMEDVTANVLHAAKAVGARIVFPGNVYGFGAQTGTPLPETAAVRPNSVKGRLRVKLETLLQGAAAEGKASALIVRAGDYFGPTVRNGLVDRIFGRAVVGKPMQVLGRLDVAHQWAYVPDLARMTLDLLEWADRLRSFEVVHFRGHVVGHAREFYDAVGRLAGHPGLASQRLPWMMIRLGGLLDPTLREVMEMRYLFDSAVVIDDPRRRELLPDFSDTPLDQAIGETLASYRAK